MCSKVVLVEIFMFILGIKWKSTYTANTESCLQEESGEGGSSTVADHSLLSLSLCSAAAGK